MSNKRPLGGKPQVVVDKYLIAHLNEHITEARAGVYITPSVTNGTSFPPVDVIVIADEFKRKFPFRYKRFKNEALSQQIKRAHEILCENSPVNGGPGETDAEVILKNALSGVKGSKNNGTGNTQAETPVKTNPTKKTKQFFESTATTQLANMTVASQSADTLLNTKSSGAGASTKPVTVVGSKSIFDDEEDSDAVDEETMDPAASVTTPVVPDVNVANNNLRKLYSSSKPKKEVGPEESKTDSAGNGKLRKLPADQLPEYLQRKLLYKELRMKGLSIDDAEKIAKNTEIQGRKGGIPSGKDKDKDDGSSASPVLSIIPTTTFRDVGGISHVLQDIRELIEYPLSHPEIYAHLGVEPPKGILLHGPPGCGKTLLAHAIAGELQVPLLKVNAPEIVSGVSGSSEAKLRQIFADAQTQAPCILFIDELDAIAPKREDSQREMEKRIVSQLLSCMDAMSSVKKEPQEVKNGSDISTAEFAMLANDTEESFIADSSDAPQQPLKSKAVIVIGATNRVDSIDMALRRPGRFDREIALGIPDDEARAHILKVTCRDLRVHQDIDFASLTKRTVGYVGADLQALTREAAVIAVNRIFEELYKNSLVNNETKDNGNGDNDDEDGAMTDMVGLDGEVCVNAKDIGPTKSQLKSLAMLNRQQTYEHFKGMDQPLTPEQLENLYIIQEDFEKAMAHVQPTAKREGFALLPDVSWDDVGALTELQAELDMAIVQPILDPKLFESIGLAVPAGVLLFGPPGCGKTLVAKAVARESGASFLSVKGPELLNQYVGQSEAAVRGVFKRARQCAPCVIFFDEIDALCPKRGMSNGNQASERVVNQMLTELDGMDERRNVFVIAATNRPDIIDPAMLRPGRLDKLLYIALPDAEGRLSILKKHVRRTPLASDVDLHKIASDKRAEGYSGADINALVREATVLCLRQVQMKKMELRKVGEEGSQERLEALALAEKLQVVVTQAHFIAAFSKVRASVSVETRLKYDRLNAKIAQNRSAIEPMAPVQEGSQAAQQSKPLD